MSWSASVLEAKPVPEIYDAIEDLEPQGQDTPEANEALEAAKTAAVALIDSGALGADCKFRVSFAGHANKDHKPTSKYVNDTVSVSVYQANS